MHYSINMELGKMIDTKLDAINQLNTPNKMENYNPDEMLN